MPLFGHQLLQLLRHFVELDGQLGEFVVAVIHQLGNARFQFAGRQTLHPLPENAYGTRDVVGQNVGQSQADQENKSQNDDFMPRLLQRQAGDIQRTRTTLDFRAVPIADEKQIFFAPAAVFQMNAFAVRIFQRILPRFLNPLGIYFPPEQVALFVAGDDEDFFRTLPLMPSLQHFARTRLAAHTESGYRIGQQDFVNRTLLVEMVFGLRLLNQPE